MSALFIDSDDGRWVLADTEEEARAFAAADDPAMILTPDGWMMNIGWDRDQYERKRDFVEVTGYGSWWESSQGPADGKATKNCKLAFAVTYAPALERNRGRES